MWTSVTCLSNSIYLWYRRKRCVKQSIFLISYLYSSNFLPVMWKWICRTFLRFTTEMHGVTSQDTLTLIPTPLRTLNVTEASCNTNQVLSEQDTYRRFSFSYLIITPRKPPDRMFLCTRFVYYPTVREEFWFLHWHIGDEKIWACWRVRVGGWTWLTNNHPPPPHLPPK